MFSILRATVCKSQAKLELLCTEWLKFSSFLGIMLLLSEKRKLFFWIPVPEIWLPKTSPKFETMTIFWISGDSILSCPTDHMCLLWFVCSEVYWKNKKRSCDLLGTTKSHALKSQKTPSSYIFVSKQMPKRSHGRK